MTLQQRKVKFVVGACGLVVLGVIWAFEGHWSSAMMTWTMVMGMIMGWLLRSHKA